MLACSWSLTSISENLGTGIEYLSSDEILHTKYIVMSRIISE
jgi:hypothetical protein